MSDEPENKEDVDFKEVRNAFTQLRESVEEMKEEKEERGEELAETKEKLERVQERLDEYDAKRNRPNYSGEGAGNDDQPSEAKQLFDDWARHGEGGENMSAREFKSWAAERGWEEEKATMLISDDTTGGYLAVPNEMAQSIIKDSVEISPMREVVGTTTISSRAWEGPKRTSTPSATYNNSETGSAAESNSTYGNIRIPTHPLTAKVVVSQQNLDDSAFDLEEEIRADVAEQFAFEIGNAIINGTGSGEPEGILNAGLTTVTGDGGSGSLDQNDPVKLTHDLKPAYFRNGQFVFNLTTLRDFRLLQDADNNFIWQPGMRAGDPDTLDGQPYTLAQDMPNPDSGNNAVAYGDFRRAYRFVERQTMTTLRDPFTNEDWSIEFRFKLRNGGQVVQDEALRLLTIP